MLFYLITKYLNADMDVVDSTTKCRKLCLIRYINRFSIFVKTCITSYKEHTVNNNFFNGIEAFSICFFIANQRGIVVNILLTTY